jgi:aromatic ring-cleaving dioxygenase
MRETHEIGSYHAHIYFDPPTRDFAVELRTTIGERFTVELGRVHDKPIGPHPKSMYQVAFAPEEFPKLVPWLMLNRNGLDILVHPNTGDDVADHAINPLWLGNPQILDIEFLRQHAASR